MQRHRVRERERMQRFTYYGLMQLNQLHYSFWCFAMFVCLRHCIHAAGHATPLRSQNDVCLCNFPCSVLCNGTWQCIMHVAHRILNLLLVFNANLRDVDIVKALAYGNGSILWRNHVMINPPRVFFPHIFSLTLCL